MFQLGNNMARSLAIAAMLMGQMAVACAPGTLNLCTHADGRSHVELSSSKCHHRDSAGSSHAHDRCVARVPTRIAPIATADAAAHDHLAIRGSAAAGGHDCGNCTDRPLVCEQSSQRTASAKLVAHLLCDCPMAGSLIDALGLPAARADSRRSSWSASGILSALATVALRC
jgi:hypothetical protein